MPLSKIKTNSLATGAITSAVMPTGSVLQSTTHTIHEYNQHLLCRQHKCIIRPFSS